MALYTIEKARNVPLRNLLDDCCSRLSVAEARAIREELQRRISSRGEPFMAGWLVSTNDWENAPFRALRDRGCAGDKVAASRCLGLFIWEAVMSHPDSWIVQSHDHDGEKLRSKFYSLLTDPHAY